jgi:ribonuclease Z
MEITFLGTSSMVPTKERSHSALFVSHKTQGILVDCGEGTQRQMKITGIKLVKINKIIISHWHGDHILGLPGLLQTLSSSSNTYSGILEIYGPPGTKKQFAMLKEALNFELSFEVKLIEVKPGVIFDNDDFRIEAAALDHSVPSYGYSIVESDSRNIKTDVIKKLGIPEGPLLGKLQDGKSVKWKDKTVTAEQVTKLTKGKKLTIIADTSLCKSCIDLADEADILICESTYANNLQEKAEQYKHLTAGQAGLIANKANVKKLILTHFSQRYKNTQQIEEDARTVFDNVIAAKDFMKVSL